MRAHSFTGELKPGVNLDRIDVDAGLRELVKCGYPESEKERHMVIEYALNRWARGEEEAAQRGAIDHAFHGIDLTSWTRVLAAARAAAENPEQGTPVTNLLSEGLCKQLVKQFFHRTKNKKEKVAVVLRELLQTTFSQGASMGQQPTGYVRVTKRWSRNSGFAEYQWLYYVDIVNGAGLVNMDLNAHGLGHMHQYGMKREEAIKCAEKHASFFGWPVREFEEQRETSTSLKEVTTR